MKKLLIFVVCFSVAMSGYAGGKGPAALKPADPSQPMQLHFNSQNDDNFLFIIPEGNYLVPGQIYFFDTNHGMRTGVYAYSDEKGRALIDY